MFKLQGNNWSAYFGHNCKSDLTACHDLNENWAPGDGGGSYRLVTSLSTPLADNKRCGENFLSYNHGVLVQLAPVLLSDFLPLVMTMQQNPGRQLPNIRFRVLIIGRANSGKTSILQRVCDTTQSPVIRRRSASISQEPVCGLTFVKICQYGLTTRLDSTRGDHRGL